jgi:hypothetical protein
MSAIILSRRQTVGEDIAMPTELRLPVTSLHEKSAWTDAVATGPDAAILATAGLTIILLVAVSFPLAPELPSQVLSQPDAAWLVGP